jgi:ubiquinone/menaquinone biosynthesis C-methylase UbiE
MNLKKLQKNWNKFGKIDPLWAILTDPAKKGNKWQIDEFFRSGEIEIETIMKYTKSSDVDIRHGKALDFGCGVGRLTQALVNYFDEVYGIDIAPSMIELANKYNKQGDKCKYYLNETDNLSLFPDDSFDFIYTNITLQHIEPPYIKNYIKEFVRVLVPNGLLIFQLPSGPIWLVDPPFNEVPRKRLKRLIRSMTPRIVYELYRNIRLRNSNEPRMETYGIRQEEIVKFLERNGARIIDITKDEGAGTDWLSFRYLVTK